MARIYLATSWRNADQPLVLNILRGLGHEVYDFRNPGGTFVDDPGDGTKEGFWMGARTTRTAEGLMGFQWAAIDPAWKDWTPAQYRAAVLGHPVASHGFTADFRAMRWADTCVLLLPSGRSAHLEAGWMAGAGKRTIVYMPQPQEPELMNLLLDDICINPMELAQCLKEGTQL